jgi:hypothetical protein
VSALKSRDTDIALGFLLTGRFVKDDLHFSQPLLGTNLAILVSAIIVVFESLLFDFDAMSFSYEDDELSEES